MGEKKKRHKKPTLREELAEYKDKYLRALAELENYRKRAAREREEFIAYANERLLTELLSIVDHFELGLEAASKLKMTKQVKNFYEGMKLTVKNFKDFLEKEGLISFSAVGKKFDPRYHEAVSVAESDDCEPETVISEIGKGYMLRDKVIRAAKVVVTKREEG